MNISCAICGDIFTGVNPDETVYVTACGHLFHYKCLIEWFARSKTCPQCRQKTSEKNIIRIFFNNANVTGADADSSFLRYTVDNLEFKLKLNEQELKTLTEEKNKAITQYKGLRNEYKTSKAENNVLQQQLYTLTDEINTLKSVSKKMSNLKLENEELKKELVSCKSVNMIINGSSDEAKCVLENSDLSVEYLQLCVKHFKERNKKLEIEYKYTEKELLSYKRQVASLKNKIDELEGKNTLNSSRDSSVILLSDDDSDKSVIGLSGTDLLNQKENIRRMISSDSIERNPCSPSSSLLDNSSIKRMRLSKPDSVYKSKSSLLGLTQPKTSFKIPKLKSSVAALGDDKYCPSKYDSTGQVYKKLKKQLSSTAISAVQNKSNETNKKIYEHFDII